MGMLSFRRLRAQEAAAAAATSIDTVVADRKTSTPEPPTFDEPAEPKPRRTRRSGASAASHTEN
jgi:hypothetical protein